MYVFKYSSCRADTMKPAYLLILSLLGLFPATTYADTIQPFTTDGCSAFPNGTLQQKSLWLNCCIAHDFAYWKGGTYEERLAADEVLRQCVAQVGEPEIGLLMRNGVRIGGTPYLPTGFRWGYGWPFPRGYQPLSDAEVQQVEAAVQGAVLRIPGKLPPRDSVNIDAGSAEQ